MKITDYLLSYCSKSVRKVTFKKETWDKLQRLYLLECFEELTDWTKYPHRNVNLNLFDGRIHYIGPEGIVEFYKE